MIDMKTIIAPIQLTNRKFLEKFSDVNYEGIPQYYADNCGIRLWFPKPSKEYAQM